MEPLQIILILTGLLIAAVGIMLLVRHLRGTGGQDLRPYVPFATVAVGLVIAYRAYADYSTLDGQDVAIMIAFVLGLGLLFGLQFFVVDKHKPGMDAAAATAQARNERDEDEQVPREL